ncbi:hypothetical protein PQ469_08515 [Mucilaginibacter sp. KACC 22773]|uniref:hypothetical protein n=1 Tax=Mucilaginibacter sp. KACC 22773 TaxID=3025671 RepID=UPI0023657251|nr:hypothetical protein [Mucilaginibacter sp. KACC 22773]WDF80045.1 hypothetical protein PQ469_08515 [Mucilaginibacter sp. KACC 22773]
MTRLINGHEFIFVVEATREPCRHACSIIDIEKIIEHIPVFDYGKLKLIILRQPKRKEEIISPVWGRLIYSYEFEGDYHPAIIIEAANYEKKITWSKSLTADDRQELDRLKADGHLFLEGKTNYTAILDIVNVRTTQLYRTLPHEFGHYVHYLEIVERPGNDEEDYEEWGKRDDVYHKISKNQKESYAHRYADKLLKKLTAEKIAPFDLRPYHPSTQTPSL